MSTAHARRAVAIALAAIVAGACAGDNEVADLTTVAPPPSATAADTTIESTAVGTTPEPTTTEPTSTEPAATTAPTTEPDLPDGPTFSDALGVRVDTAPGVHTRGDTRQLLPEGLYVHVAWEADPNDPSVFTVQPDDIEILEAYANAVTTYYRAALTTLTTDDPAFAEYYMDAGAKFDESLSKARAGGYLLSLGSGVTLRPYIPADGRPASTALILDCYLQDQAFYQPADGTPSPRVQQTSPTVASMVRIGDRWLVDVTATDPSACL